MIKLNKYYKINYNYFDNNTKNKLKLIYNKIYKLYKSPNCIKSLPIPINIDLKTSHYLTKLKTQFLSNTIYKYIIDNFNKLYIITYLNITIYYFCDNDINKYHSFSNKSILYDINIIIKRVNIIKKCFKNNNNISIYLFPSHFTKNIKNIPISINEVNSGYNNTYTNEICIWRYEELYKVITHEILHHILLDQFIYKTNDLNDFFKNYFNIDKFININESFNEFYTVIYHNIFNCMENKFLYDNKKNIFNNILLNINKERYFSLYQATKILQKYNYNNIKVQNNKIFNQNSAVFSYYIIKFFLLYNINIVLKYNINNNIEKLKFIIIKCHEKSIKIINNSLSNNNKLYNMDSSLKMSFLKK
jgi:hypothetical protein